MLLRLLKIAALVVLAFTLVQPAEAARRDKKEEAKETAMFPNAARAEPEIKQAKRSQKKLKELYELSQTEDTDKTVAAAEEMLENKVAGPYERSLAAQILGVARIDQDDYPAAIAAFERALTENGLANNQHYQIMYQISQLYLSDEDYEHALVWLDRFMAETKSDKPDHIAMRGNALYRMERYPEAEQAMRQAISASENPSTAWYQLLMATYFETEQMDKAALIAEEQLAKNPDDKALIRNLSSIYLNAEQNDKAVALLEGAKARGLLTEERDYRQLYQLYHYAEKEAEAIATIEEGLAKGLLKEDLDTYRALGEANYFGERIPQAIDAYKKAATFAKDGEMALMLGRILAEEERWKETKAAINDALAKGIRRKGDAYIVLGAAEFGLNNRDAGIAAYREAAKYPETESMAKSWLKQAGVK